MVISLIAAMARNRVIGKDNHMPWHLPADLRHFKQVTIEKPVIMGRKTYDSIGRPLPGRQNLVISRDANLTIAGVEIFASLESAIRAASDAEEIIVMGGATIYQQALPLANRLYLTFIELVAEGDAFFPEWDLQEWHEISHESHASDDQNPYAYSFTVWER